MTNTPEKAPSPLGKLFRQAVKFGLVGVLNTLVDYGVYSLLILIPFLHQNYLIAQVIGYGCGVLNSLFFNKRWTFKQKEKMSKKQLLLFIAVNLAALGVSSLLLWALREGLYMNLYGAKLFSIVGSLAVNFLGNKLLVFRDGKSTARAKE